MRQMPSWTAVALPVDFRKQTSAASTSTRVFFWGGSAPNDPVVALDTVTMQAVALKWPNGTTVRIVNYSVGQCAIHRAQNEKHHLSIR